MYEPWKFEVFACGATDEEIGEGVLLYRPRSRDPPEKMINIFASENEAYTIY